MHQAPGRLKHRTVVGQPPQTFEAGAHHRTQARVAQHSADMKHQKARAPSTFYAHGPHHLAQSHAGRSAHQEAMRASSQAHQERSEQQGFTHEIEMGTTKIRKRIANKSCALKQWKKAPVSNSDQTPRQWYAPKCDPILSHPGSWRRALPSPRPPNVLIASSPGQNRHQSQ